MASACRPALLPVGGLPNFADPGMLQGKSLPFDGMMETEAEKLVPMIMGVGASAVQMVRMGDLTMSVITHYADAEAAKNTQAKITEIRAAVAR